MWKNLTMIVTSLTKIWLFYNFSNFPRFQQIAQIQIQNHLDLNSGLCEADLHRQVFPGEHIWIVSLGEGRLQLLYLWYNTIYGTIYMIIWYTYDMICYMMSPPTAGERTSFCSSSVFFGGTLRRANQSGKSSLGLSIKRGKYEIRKWQMRWVRISRSP